MSMIQSDTCRILPRWTDSLAREVKGDGWCCEGQLDIEGVEIGKVD